MDYQTPPLIPMSSPDLTEVEQQAILSVVKTSGLSMGPHILAFESAFCRFTSCRYAIAVNSGTAGLHLCIRAAGVKSGDYVITTPFSFVASANVILFEQATPIFVDVDPETGNIDPELMRQAADDLTSGGKAAKYWLPRRGIKHGGQLKALLPVDVFGQPVDMDSIQQIANKHQLPIIEDACESLGAEYKGRKAGTLGNYGVYAFYPNKQITTGEGGLIVTDDEQAAQMMRALRNQGRAPGDTWLQHTLLGYNYRLDEMSAALGKVQMDRIEYLLNSRTQVAEWYDELLTDIDEVEPPYNAPTTSRVSWFVYVIRLKKGFDRMKIAERLAQQGVPVRPYFLPIHLQPYMLERFGYERGDFPVTEDLGERGMAMPFSGKMTQEQVTHVCQALKQAITK